MYQSVLDLMKPQFYIWKMILRIDLKNYQLKINAFTVYMVIFVVVLFSRILQVSPRENSTSIYGYLW